MLGQEHGDYTLEQCIYVPLLLFGVGELSEQRRVLLDDFVEVHLVDQVLRGFVEVPAVNGEVLKGLDFDCGEGQVIIGQVVVEYALPLDLRVSGRLLFVPRLSGPKCCGYTGHHCAGA